ncbi:thiol:disulfide interchange protein DsbA/DsbL [Pseudomonas chlororaphis]|uniref:thiol:disulfide interchange protein DsbA/DsbL n=1 Tax=Pseudomonas chlororaphis TaxID=587753 RepID=UPI0023674DA5|nr:thiol:disulfide interchange protein DsbA/DsbL [Pseudomonas chlororaphis]WDG77612.1 thiol:disulfide interchange protein DsbA/DsbL [Pseudomonas chlororaphis]WDG83151.1 thiol:disulfide interchange protein DsbA/DsbL [Pseudomonas chlororaphis]
MRKFWLVLVVPAIFNIPMGMAAPVAPLQAGKNYTVTNEQPSQSPKVLEFFSFGCPHCRAIDPSIAQWAAKAGNDVPLTRVPVTFGNKQWEGYAKAFYVGEALDIQVVTNHALFELARRGGKLETAKEIADFFVGLCIDRKIAEQQINSFAVKSRMVQGDKLAQRYKIQVVPSFVVNDKYFTDASMVGSPEAVPAALTRLATLRD